MNHTEYIELFTRLGRIINFTNSYLDLQDTIDVDLDTLLVEFDNNTTLERGLISAYDGIKSGAAGFISALLGRANIILTDYQVRLFAPSSDAGTMWDYIINDMAEGDETVNNNILATPTLEENSNNIGNGTLLLSVDTPDPSHQPGRGEIEDERILAQQIELLCTRDRHTGTSRGNETFTTIGYPLFATNTNNTRGNGNGPTLTPLDSLLSNASFEDFDNNGWNSWEIDVGKFSTSVAATTETGAIDGNLGPSTDSYIGTYAARFTSDRFINSIQISQSISLDVDKIFVATFRIKRPTEIDPGSTFGIYLVGDGFTEELITLDPATLDFDTWSLQNVFFILPEDPPDDLTIAILWEGVAALDNESSVLIDQVVIGEPTIFGHLQYVLIQGNVDYIRGDKIIATSNNDYDGIIQTWVGRFYNKLLPSATGTGDPTIDDSLANGDIVS